MRKRIRNRIEYLRSQPEHVRFRAASYITIVGGVAIVVLWLTVLLPLQLFFQGPGDDSEVPGVVSGVQDPQPSASPSPTPTPSIFL